VSGAAGAPGDLGSGFLAFYDDALPHVYGYLAARCRTRAVAEDLTTETFLAAIDAVRRDDPPPVSVRWIIGVARHKLADHWRREARQQRHLHELVDEAGGADPWEEKVDAIAARRALDLLAPQQRAALTLRYLDDLPVPEVATLLGRTVHATEALLVRSKAAFRRCYHETEGFDA
jgi:RNA polymerase sigma-70 factor (ECF subfamily)